MEDGEKKWEEEGMEEGKKDVDKKWEEEGMEEGKEEGKEDVDEKWEEEGIEDRIKGRMKEGMEKRMVQDSLQKDSKCSLEELEYHC